MDSLKAEITCIVCPNGCLLEIEYRGGTWLVAGNQCRRGEQFAVEEMTHPMRTITSTVRTIFPEVPMLPVRVSAEIPKEKIFDVMQEIHGTVVKETCGTKDVLISNVSGLGVDVIVTSNVLKESRQGEYRRKQYENVCEKGENVI